MARERFAPEAVSRRPRDALSYREGSRPVLVTAFHATPPVRDGHARPAESDSGVLADVLHETFGYSCLTIVGPQSGDANWDPNHPARSRLETILGEFDLVLDLHMMRDVHGPELCIGLGPEPNAASGSLAAFAGFAAVERGIACSINWPFPAKPRTTTAFVQSRSGTALQLETAVRLYEPETGSTARLLAWWSMLDRHLRTRARVTR
jgi:hypothetical protein